MRVEESAQSIGTLVEAMPRSGTEAVAASTPRKNSVTRSLPQTPCRNLPPWADEKLKLSAWSKIRPEAQAAILLAFRTDRWPLLLYGGAGRGKSCAAAYAYERFPRSIDPNASILWLRFTEQLRLITTARRDGQAAVKFCRQEGAELVETVAQKSDDWMLNRIRFAAFVVLDDIGMRTPTEPQLEAAIDLLEVRSGKPTIVTSNLDPTRISEVFDDRVTSRLCAGTFAEVLGGDMRLE